MTVPGVGPKPAKIMFVAEAPGQHETEQSLPLVGPSGYLFNTWLARAGINRAECYITNVLWERPPGNDLEKFTVSKKELPANYYFPPISRGTSPRYLAPDRIECLDRLAGEIKEVNPNIIVALGGFAAWALIRQTEIKKLRGYIYPCGLVAGKKVLPTYHPAYILRSRADAVSVHADFKKIAYEAEFPEINYPNTSVCIEPSISDIRRFIEMNRAAAVISIDIETEDQITCVSFSTSPDYAIVVPFKDPRKLDGNYWETPAIEIAVWRMVEEILCLPGDKLFQNGSFDLQWFLRMGLRLQGKVVDTMLLHHANWPSMLKGLGYMGSLHTRRPNWKLLADFGSASKKEE